MRLPFAFALLVAAPAGAEESLSPLDLARQTSAEGPLYAYDMTLETSELTASGKIDPAQPEGSRVTILFSRKRGLARRLRRRSERHRRRGGRRHLVLKNGKGRVRYRRASF